MSFDPSLDPTYSTRGRAAGEDTGASDRAPPAAGPVTLGRGRGLTRLTSEHLIQVSTLFREVFPDNPLSLLGIQFLSALMASFITIPQTCGYVYLVDGEVVGFVVGTMDSRVYRQELIRRRWFTLLARVASALLRSPTLVRPVISYLSTYPLQARDRTLARGADWATVPPASLIFLGVTESYRGRGVAAALTDHFLQRMRESHVGQVKLAVGATNYAARRFYEKHGWQTSGCFPVPVGGMAYRLIYDLSTDRSPAEPRALEGGT